MILKYSWENFYSFCEDYEVSLLVGHHPTRSLFDLEVDESTRANKVMAVLGPNGSGKTQLLKVLPFIAFFASSSFRDIDAKRSIPFKPHLAFLEAPSKFQIEFVIDQKHYQYSFTLLDGAVLEEQLKFKSTHLFTTIFKRVVKNDVEFVSGQSLSSLGLPRAFTKSLRRNASLISTAVQFESEELTKIADYFSGFNTNIISNGRDKLASLDVFAVGQIYYENSELNQKMQSIMRSFDLGIERIDFELIKTKGENGELHEVPFPVFIHNIGDKEIKIPIHEESNGTQSAFCILSKLLLSLITGNPCILDEIDNDLHPHLLPYIIDLFKHKHTNPHGAQLLFSCHSPEVLNRLGKHQIYLTEKIDNMSETWRVDEIKGLRNDSNIYAKYMAGALQAIPELD